MGYRNCNTHFRTTGHRFTVLYDREIAKLKDNYETLFDERYCWKKIRNLSRDIVQLEKDFRKAVDDKLAQQTIRDEIKRKDELVLKLALEIIAIQEHANYRPTSQNFAINMSHMSPMEMAQHEMKDITRMISEIFKKKRDCEKLKNLTGQKENLYRELRRLGHIPSKFYQLRSEMCHINSHINALRRKYWSNITANRVNLFK